MVTKKRPAATKSARQERGRTATKRPSLRSLAGTAPVVLGALLVAVLLAAFGIVQLRGNALLSGFLAILIALALFVFASGRMSAMSFSKQELVEMPRTWLPAAVLVLAVFLSFLAAYQVTLPRSPETLRAAKVAWILGLILLVAGVLWLEHWRPRIQAYRDWIRNNAREVILLLVIIAVGAAARMYQLEQHPYPWSGDEASVGIEGRRIITGENTDMFNTGWSGQPNLSFYPTAAALAIFGNSIYPVRLVSALIGIATILTLYLLSRELFGQSIALLAAGFLAAFPFHLQFSRIGVNNIFDGLMVTLCLWLVMRAVRKEDLLAYAMAGIATGLTLYTYVGSRLVVALAFAAFAYVALRQKGFLRANLRHLGVYLASVWIASAPMVAFFLKHPDIFMTRLGQAGILLNGWLPREAARTGKNVLSILFEQFTRSTLVYISASAHGNFFNSPEPYLTIMGSLFFLLGMAFAFRQLLKIPYMITLLWFWSVVFLGGVLTLDPPANTRLVMTAPAVAIFVAIGIAKLLDILGVLSLSAAWRFAVGALIVTFLAVQNLIFYFGAYRTGNYFQDANAEVAMEAGGELSQLGSDYSLYLIGQPRMFSGFPTIPFLAPGSPRSDIRADEAATAQISTDGPAFIVATPDNLSALEEIARRYPGGKWEEIPRRTKPETLYFAYILSEPTQP